jgi:hypothetical protein
MAQQGGARGGADLVAKVAFPVLVFRGRGRKSLSFLKARDFLDYGKRVVETKMTTRFWPKSSERKCG